MKYIAKSTGYLIIWLFLTPYLAIERITKSIHLLLRIVWHFRIDTNWFEPFTEYDFLIPINVNYHPIFWRKIKRIKDYYLLKNWERIKYY
jgi:hypothetical protein